MPFQNGDSGFVYFAIKNEIFFAHLGSPGFASPTWMEVFNSSVLPRTFASVIKGERSAEDAASAADAEVKRLAEKWKDD